MVVPSAWNGNHDGTIYMNGTNNSQARYFAARRCSALSTLCEVAGLFASGEKK